MNKLNQFFLLLAYLVMPFVAVAQNQPSISARKSGNAAIIQSDAGKWVFTTYPNHIIKVQFTPKGSDKNEQVSDAVIAKANLQSPVIKTGNNFTGIHWPGSVDIQVKDKEILFNLLKQTSVTLTGSFYSAGQRGFTFSLEPGEKIFGTGERSLPMNRRGYKLPLNNNPWYGYALDADALNFSVPFILSSKHYAILFDNPSKGYLDIGKTNPGQLEYSVISGELSFYIIPGKDYNTILTNYQHLVGTQPLPPRWAMGNFMSRFGYTSEQQTREIISRMKKDSIPFDAVIFDLFWFGDSIKNTMGNLAWVNKTAWPNPAKMISDFKKDHIQTILITEPFVLKTSLNYEASRSFHAVDFTGKPYVLTDFYFGQGGIIDIFRKDAQQWFFGKYKEQMDIGVSGWWGDLGEPEKHPEGIFHNLGDLGFSRKFAADEVHNIFGHFWSKMLSENFKKTYPHKRLFHLNRSGYAGSPRFSSFPWSGDVSRSWDGLKGQLPLMQGMSVSGIPYIHSDAGGFAGGDGDAELYVRWLQFAAFTPVYRPHGTALGSIEPGVKDIPSEAALWPEPAKSHGRNAAVTRYRWLPYNYNLCYLQTKYGKPLVMPLFFLNDKDSNLYKAADQYLWGDQVMVVPVTEKGQTAKTYYIPESSWTNLNNMQVKTGPQWFTDSNITISNIPLWAKEGSFIPFAGPMQHTASYNEKPLTITYIPSVKPSQYELYEDDGSNPDAISAMQYEITRFKSSGTGRNVTITITGNGGKYPGQAKKRNMVLDIPHIGKVKSVLINGKETGTAGISNETINGISIPLVYERKPVTIRIQLK